MISIVDLIIKKERSREFFRVHLSYLLHQLDTQMIVIRRLNLLLINFLNTKFFIRSGSSFLDVYSGVVTAVKMLEKEFKKGRGRATAIK